MSVLLQFTVPAPAFGAARPRFSTKRGLRTYMPPEHVQWERMCTLLAQSLWLRRAPIAAPISVEIVAHHSRPLRLRRQSDPRGVMWARAKPDLDNVAKIVLDALVKAQVMEDDTCVAELHCSRLWLPIGNDATDLGRERVDVRVLLCPPADEENGGSGAIPFPSRQTASVSDALSVVPSSETVDRP